MAIDQDKLDKIKKRAEASVMEEKKRTEAAAAKKKESEIDEKNNSEEVLREKDKQEQLQKVKEDADLWEERRNTLKDKVAEISVDPQAWLKGFLMKKAMEAGHYAISKKRRLEVAVEKEKEIEIDKKNNSDKLKTAVELKKLEIEPAEIKFGFEAEQLKGMVETLKGIELNGQKSIETISNTLVSNNISSTNNSKEMVEKISEVVLVNTEQLKQDSKQFKADNRTSAAEEAAGVGSKTGIGGVLTGGNSDKNKSVVEDGVGGIMSTIQDVITEGAGGMIAERVMGGRSSGKPNKKSKTKAGGLKGILKNIMMKFGKAGKFLMSLGARFLLPLITTPVGWAVLAGLAVGGLVFAYWDNIVSFVGKMFDGVKSMFSKVVSKISSMFSAVGNAIKDVIAFFNPLNLYKMLIKAILPAKYYNAIVSFFGPGDTNKEEKKAGGLKGISSQEKSTPKPVTIGMNDVVWDDPVPQIKPNENSILRKDEMVSGALQKGMDNNISQGSGNWGKKSSDTNIVAPTVNNNSTNIRQEKTHDTDITNLSLNASAVISPNQNW
jgi:hypothetical protein